jgi:phosphohistidine swiveling domain-containing protein
MATLLRPTSSIALCGVPAARGRGSGPLRAPSTADAAAAAPAGSVLLFHRLPVGWIARLRAPSAVLLVEGGALSNPAIALRERGIPAVAALGAVAAWLREGDHVRVDGTTGRVLASRPD